MTLGYRAPRLNMTKEFKDEQNELYHELRKYFLEHLYDRVRGLNNEINVIKVVGPSCVGKPKNVGIHDTTEPTYWIVINKSGKY